MATLTSPVVIDRPSSGAGQGGPPPRHRDGGGGGRNDGTPDYDGRMRRARLGLMVALAPISALFLCFTAAYALRHGTPQIDVATGERITTWTEVHLPLKLLVLTTSILLASSATMEMARRKVARQSALAPLRSIPGVAWEDRGGFPWLSVTLVLGLGFLVGQWMAWRELQTYGFSFATTVSSAFFYLLTGTHAAHLAGGIIALGYAQTASLLHKPVEFRRIVVDVTAWYWHFMALLWIYVFCLLYFAR
jgi:cytochrome c oxidase subunit III